MAIELVARLYKPYGLFVHLQESYKRKTKIIIMPRLDKTTKEQIKALDVATLREIVTKLASKEKMVYDFVLANYLDKETGETDLFNAAKADLDYLFWKGYKGFSEQLRMANMLSACIKRVNEFTKVSGNKIHEAELLMYVLEVPFSMPENSLGTCFTQFDYKVGLLVKRLITLVTKKLHEDFRLDYAEKLNEYLRRLHQTSDHIDMICLLPEKI